MNAKRRIIMGISSLVMVFVIAISSITITLAALSANVDSGFSISYTANNVKALIGGFYGLDMSSNVFDPTLYDQHGVFETGDIRRTKDGTSFYDTIINFTGKETSAAQNFRPIGQLALTEDAPTVCLQYFFINCGNNALPMKISMNTPENLNVRFGIYNGTLNDAFPIDSSASSTKRTGAMQDMYSWQNTLPESFNVPVSTCSSPEDIIKNYLLSSGVNLEQTDDFISWEDYKRIKKEAENLSSISREELMQMCIDCFTENADNINAVPNLYAYLALASCLAAKYYMEKDYQTPFPLLLSLNSVTSGFADPFAEYETAQEIIDTYTNAASPEDGPSYDAASLKERFVTWVNSLENPNDPNLELYGYMIQYLTGYYLLEKDYDNFYEVLLAYYNLTEMMGAFPEATCLFDAFSELMAMHIFDVLLNEGTAAAKNVLDSWLEKDWIKEEDYTSTVSEMDNLTPDDLAGIQEQYDSSIAEIEPQLPSILEEIKAIDPEYLPESMEERVERCARLILTKYQNYGLIGSDSYNAFYEKFKSITLEDAQTELNEVTAIFDQMFSTYDQAVGMVVLGEEYSQALQLEEAYNEFVNGINFDLEEDYYNGDKALLFFNVLSQMNAAATLGPLYLMTVCTTFAYIPITFVAVELSVADLSKPVNFSGDISFSLGS